MLVGCGSTASSSKPKDNDLSDFYEALKSDTAVNNSSANPGSSASHSLTITYQSVSKTSHQVVKSCSTCGYSSTGTASHSMSNGKCTLCGYDSGISVTPMNIKSGFETAVIGDDAAIIGIGYDPIQADIMCDDCIEALPDTVDGFQNEFYEITDTIVIVEPEYDEFDNGYDRDIESSFAEYETEVIISVVESEDKERLDEDEQFIEYESEIIVSVIESEYDEFDNELFE